MDTATLKALRKAKGWTIAELSKYARVSPGLISEIESGVKDPSEEIGGRLKGTLTSGSGGEFIPRFESRGGEMHLFVTEVATGEEHLVAGAKLRGSLADGTPVKLEFDRGAGDITEVEEDEQP